MLWTMEIIVARHMGFCGGVKRAVEMARSTAEDAQGDVFTWGPLIHNPQVVQRLEQTGVQVADRLEALHGEAFVVSAYGVEHAVLDAARGQGMRIVDATCPVVIRAHSLAHKLVDEGYQLVVVGDHGHPEMVTLKEALGEKVTVVHTRAEAAQVKLRGRVAVMSQTTQSQENFRQIVGDLSLRTKELRVVNTLCPAITVRQEEAEQIVEEADALVVVGGHHSSNTTRLFEIGRTRGLPTYHIEVAGELDPNWFAGVARVGVMSGASTPDWIITTVLHRLDEIGRLHESTQSTRPTQSTQSPAS
jgi:(E)-4-hydroxy-3-methyl-but-2-enyl pyrophosphate reductase